MVFVKAQTTNMGSHQWVWLVAPSLEVFLTDTKQGTYWNSSLIKWEEVSPLHLVEGSPDLFEGALEVFRLSPDRTMIFATFFVR